MSKTFRTIPPGDWTNPELFKRGLIFFGVRCYTLGYAHETIRSPKAKKLFKKKQHKKNRKWNAND